VNLLADPGQPESFADKNRAIIAIVIIAFVLIIGYIAISQGVGSAKDFIWSLVKWVIFFAIFGLIIWAVLKFLQKPRVDLVSVDIQNIVEAGVLSKPPMLKDLYFTGDKEHGEFRVGKIIGYCQLQSYKDLNKIAGLSEEELEDLRQKGIDPSQYIIKEDCFVFKKFGFPFGLFEQPKVLRTLENEHSQLVGDVKIFAVSMIKKYDQYFPNRAHLDIARIDHAVIKEAWRGGVHEFLKDMVQINQRAVGLDSEHKKSLDERKLLKIPSPLGESQDRGQ
jgi:hypothetical protein